MRGQGPGSQLQALSTEGAELWQQSPAGSTHTSTPLYGFGSLFYLGCANGPWPLTRRSDTTGELAWEHEDPGNHPSPCFSNAVLDSDVGLDKPAKVYFGHRNNPPVVKAVRVSSGTSLWEQPLSANGEVLGLALTQNREHNALIVAQRDRLYRLDRDNGEILWEHSFAANQSFSARHKRRPQPIIWGDYVFHVSEGRRVLKALDLASGTEVWRFELDSSTDASPIAGGNTLYIGTESGRFYAFSPAD